MSSMRAVKVMIHLEQPAEFIFLALLSVTLKCGWREIVICTGTD